MHTAPVSTVWAALSACVNLDLCCQKIDADVTVIHHNPVYLTNLT